MEQLRQRNEQYAGLFKRVVLSRYPLDAVAEVEAFYKEYRTSPDFEEIKMHCESLISAIYFYNDLYDLSLKIDLTILKTLPSHHDMYCAIINRATESGSRSGKADKVLPFVLNYLEKPAQEFYKILFLFRWLIQHYPTNEKLKSYELTLSSIATEMGAVLDDEKTFSENVEFLVSELHRGDKDLYALKIAYRDEPKDRFPEILDEYLANERLMFFRDQAIKEFKS